MKNKPHEVAGVYSFVAAALGYYFEVPWLHFWGSNVFFACCFIEVALSLFGLGDAIHKFNQRKSS